MASLSTVVAHLTNIVHSPHTEPLHCTKKDIKDCLDRCDKPEDILLWHVNKMKSDRTYADCECLRRLCTNVTSHLCYATQRVAHLQRWALGHTYLLGTMTPRQYFNTALRAIIHAFREFHAVSKTEQLRTTNNMEMVQAYLQMVYRITLVLVEVAFPPDTAKQYFCYWTEYLDATGLEGFQFDSLEEISRLWNRDRTLRGVLAIARETPETYLPSNPTFPVFIRREGHYGPPVLRNAISADWQEYWRSDDDHLIDGVEEMDLT